MQQRIMQQKSFWDRGCQYYVTGRFAVAAGLNPVAGNLLHHAVEFLLKGALSKTQTLDDLRKHSHKLLKIWEVFKTAIGDAALGRFDPAIAALHAYEDLRYPDDALKNGMASTISSHRLPNLAGNAGLPLPPGLPPEISADRFEPTSFACRMSTNWSRRSSPQQKPTRFCCLMEGTQRQWQSCSRATWSLVC